MMVMVMAVSVVFQGTDALTQNRAFAQMKLPKPGEGVHCACRDTHNHCM